MLVPAAVPLAPAPAEALLTGPAEELLELLQAATRIAATATPAAARDARLARVNVITLLDSEGWPEWRFSPEGEERSYCVVSLSVTEVAGKVHIRRNSDNDGLM
jgi:hypothetical protein